MKLKPILEELLPGASKIEDRKLKRQITALKLLSGKEKSAEMEKILARVNRVRRADDKPELTRKGFGRELALIKGSLEGIHKLDDNLKRRIDNYIEKNKHVFFGGDMAKKIGALARLMGLNPKDVSNKDILEYAGKRIEEIIKEIKVGDIVSFKTKRGVKSARIHHVSKEGVFVDYYEMNEEEEEREGLFLSFKTYGKTWKKKEDKFEKWRIKPEVSRIAPGYKVGPKGILVKKEESGTKDSGEKPKTKALQAAEKNREYLKDKIKEGSKIWIERGGSKYKAKIASINTSRGIRVNFKDYRGNPKIQDYSFSSYGKKWWTVADWGKDLKKLRSKVRPLMMTR